MSEEPAKKDNFSLYVATTAILIITVIGVIKMSESEKFAPIKEQLKQETAQMNVRVISKKDYEQ